ncbi:MAG: transglycosylase domain-containing protein [Bacteroidaceae bacterium]|nr:transglycosylase domain-containing protein [Bacteroidaceae bacterium]
MRKKFFIITWLIFILIIGIVSIIFWGIAKGRIGYLPNLEELQNPISRYASQIVTADGKLLGTWSRSENRVFVDYEEISPYTLQALVATEDERFYEHSGIDVKSLLRAIVKRGILQQSSAGGGSTITQQLAKQLYSAKAENKFERMMQKPIEWVIAIELERRYTKEEILTLYLNYFDFLYNAVGIKTAAQVYFGKLPKDLTIEESATLIGMCKNPSYFNPVRRNERCKERRNVVLGQMLRSGFLASAEVDSLQNLPLTLNFKRVDHRQGQGTYLREYLRTTLTAKKPKLSNYAKWQRQQYYEDSLAWETNPIYGWCHKNKKANGDSYDIYTDGLKIYTTIDSRMQTYAEKAVVDHVGLYLQREFERSKRSANFPYSNNLTQAQVNEILGRTMKQSERYIKMKASGSTAEEIETAFKTPVEMSIFTYEGVKDTVMTPMDSIRHYKKFLRSGLVSIEPQTGYVKAYVGGLNYTYFQYDMASMGRRQVGSTMKPFVYAMAMEDGVLPTDTIRNIQRTYQVGDQQWTPRNSSDKCYGDYVTLKWGLSQSNNWITAELMYQSDPNGHRLANYLKLYGIANADIYPSLALCLGSCDITVAEMASAYTAFANKGIRCAPILITHIEDINGNVISDFSPKMNEVISEESSYKMLDMMQAVVNEGTGVRLRYRYNFEAAIAGKTGTTNSNSDGWFVGIVPRLVTACWVGGEERDIHFTTTAMGQGAATALPVWANYMKQVYADSLIGYRQNEKFDIDSTFMVNKVDESQSSDTNDLTPSTPVEKSKPNSLVEEDNIESFFE